MVHFYSMGSTLVASAKYPIVLCFSGHDPTGGAGIQADIEAVGAQGCAAATVITCLTVQDTGNVRQMLPVDAKTVSQQARTLLSDLHVDAIKIGLIGNAEVAAAVVDIIAGLPQVPVVTDPVLTAGGGAELAGPKLLQIVRDRLLGMTTLITPNSEEARRLAGRDRLDVCAEQLLDSGCGAVLITGGHDGGKSVTNRLYRPDLPVIASDWPRLPNNYHGSGCTLAASVAALIARGIPLETAVARAQAYTWQSLSRGWRPGRGQHLPDRLFACSQSASE